MCLGNGSNFVKGVLATPQESSSHTTFYKPEPSKESNDDHSSHRDQVANSSGNRKQHSAHPSSKAVQNKPLPQSEHTGNMWNVTTAGLTGV